MQRIVAACVLFVLAASGAHIVKIGPATGKLAL